MNIILLSGGSGKRLWPLSNSTRSKQFLKVLKNEKGEYESMVQRVFRQIKSVYPDSNVIIATGMSQLDAIESQLGNAVDVVLEPERRDTFPAIALSSSYLVYEKKVNKEEVVLVLPVDPFAEIEYFELLKKMELAAKDGLVDIVLMGIKPTYPSAKYGYIQSINDTAGLGIDIVRKFIEKPSEELAAELIKNGAMWNGGVFAFKLNYILDIVNKYISDMSFSQIKKNYGMLKKNSFDYEVVEKATSIGMVTYDKKWKDLGTWNTLTEEIKDNHVGNVIIDEFSSNTHVINELNIPIVTLGGKDLIIVASHDGILVTDKMRSSYLKEYISEISDRPMYAEQSWGEYKIIERESYNDGNNSMIKNIKIYAGRVMQLIKTLHDEVSYSILNGEGTLYYDNNVKSVKAGDVINDRNITNYEFHAKTDMQILEVSVSKSDL